MRALSGNTWLVTLCKTRVRLAFVLLPIDVAASLNLASASPLSKQPAVHGILLRTGCHVLTCEHLLHSIEVKEPFLCRSVAEVADGLLVSRAVGSHWIRAEFERGILVFAHILASHPFSKGIIGTTRGFAVVVSFLREIVGFIVVVVGW